jgi:hypothetical protein
MPTVRMAAKVRLRFRQRLTPVSRKKYQNR